ncbi:hypothetical protein [Nonomuraea sp. NPDC050540]|uniref:hypothetical protein n=1 Tax=Nonomuraea sp. NPDC050540 TaxID=3364367 RepID=UPI00378FFF26
MELQVRDVVKDLPPVFAAFYADQAARTCRDCGALHPGKGWRSSLLPPHARGSRKR